jgi:AraC-like DNA-binding protein
VARDRLDGLAGQIYEEQTLRGAGWQAMAEGLLAQWLVMLGREVQARAADPDAAAAGRLVDAARAHVADHLDRSLTLDAVAGRFGVSAEHLTRRFRAELGVPFHRYVLRRRLAEARRLLHEAPDLTITTIALRVGFGSLSAFSRAFRQAVGVSPRTYRSRPSSAPARG